MTLTSSIQIAKFLYIYIFLYFMPLEICCISLCPHALTQFTYTVSIAYISQIFISYIWQYYYFVRLMGRKASHVALECALQSHPNMVRHILLLFCVLLVDRQYRIY